MMMKMMIVRGIILKGNGMMMREWFEDDDDDVGQGCYFVGK